MEEMVTLKFPKPGMLTTIQDFGRPNFREYGVPCGGALDKKSAIFANWLVGNEDGNPLLEITMMGPEIYFDEPCQIALTGADISPKLNGQEIQMWETISVERYSVLKFGKLKNGCRTYLAVRGKWQVEKWLGSASFLPFSGLNVLENNLIKKGSEIIIEKKEEIKPRKILAIDRPIFSSPLKIKTLPGPEFEFFPRIYIAQFFNRPFRVSINSNRMGCRLEGEFSSFIPKKELISSGVIPGTIQITNNGQPIVLLSDAQTTGGYYRLANIVSEDLDKMAQVKPGDEVVFSVGEH